MVFKSQRATRSWSRRGGFWPTIDYPSRRLPRGSASTPSRLKGEALSVAQGYLKLTTIKGEAPLNKKEFAPVIRTLLRRRFGAGRAKSLEELLASGPLQGIELTREAHRQSLIVTRSRHARKDQDFIDAI